MSALLDRAAIAARIPHAGSMCLLSEVVAWDAATIHCRAMSHRDPHNPLRIDGRLGAVHAIEYGAQAMALHGALLAGDGAAASRPGYIGAVRAVELLASVIPETASALDIRVERIDGDDCYVVYGFAVAADGKAMASGRISVAFAAAGAATD
jgi:predicted hotdog family 3-hydroxylacyl-ACP dehydratase